MNWGRDGEMLSFARDGMDWGRSAAGTWCAIGPLLSGEKNLVCGGGIDKSEMEGGIIQIYTLRRPNKI